MQAHVRCHQGLPHPNPSLLNCGNSKNRGCTRWCSALRPATRLHEGLVGLPLQACSTRQPSLQRKAELPSVPVRKLTACAAVSAASPVSGLLSDHPGIWLGLATVLVLACHLAALKLAADTDQVPSPAIIAAALTHLLGEVLFIVLVPCWLASIWWSAPLWQIQWGPFLLVSALTLGCSLTGAFTGYVCGKVFVSLWQFVLELRALSADQGPVAWSSSINRQGRGWLSLPRFKPLSSWGPLFSWPPSEESAMAGAVAKALGAPQAEQALLPFHPQPPAWLPTALLCIGAAAGSAAAYSLQSDSVTAAAWSAGASIATSLSHAITALMPDWLLTQASQVLAIASDSICLATRPGSCLWSEGAIVTGQAIAMWGVVQYVIRHHMCSSSSQASPDNTPNLTTPRIPGWFKTMHWRNQAGGGGGGQIAGRPRGAEPEGVPDLPQGRVWVRLGDNQEVLLSPQELAQLVPYNTPLAGSMRVSQQQQQGAGAQVAGEGTEEGEVVAAEVREYAVPDAGSSAGGDSSEAGQAGWGRRLGMTWTRIWTCVLATAAAHPPLAGLLIGLVAAVAVPSPAFVAAREQSTAAHLASHPAAVVLQAVPHSSSKTASQSGTQPAATHQPDGLHPVGGSSADPHHLQHTAPLDQEHNHVSAGLATEAHPVVMSSDDEVDDMLAAASPWDWRMLKALLSSAVGCCAWAATTTPTVLTLFAACATASACMRKSSWAGAHDQGLDSSPEDSALGGTTGQGWDMLSWKPSGGGSPKPSPLVLARLLLIPNNIIDLVLLLSSCLTTMVLVPGALALAGTCITWCVPASLPVHQMTTLFWTRFSCSCGVVWQWCASLPTAAMYVLLIRAEMWHTSDSGSQAMSTSLRVQMMNSMALLLMRVMLAGGVLCWATVL